MTRTTLEDDLALAHELADLARTISLAMFRGDFGQRRKADGSIVTDADEAVERAIRERLTRARPDDAMLGEEFGASGSGARRWIFDAIDGTHSFAVGSPQWGTLIALELEGEVVAGICDMAPIGRRYWAARGMGAYQADDGKEPQRLRVSTAGEIHNARCFVPGPEWCRGEDRERSQALAGLTRPVVPEDHPALVVAAGDLEIAGFFLGGAWDLAAPAIVVTEAGGRFSDLEGGTSLERGGGLFSNGLLHESALDVVGRR